jgi:holliday junction DNA helicase RuvB
MTEPRVVTASASPDEERIERAIRPHQLADYVGQPAVKEQLGITMS